MQMTENEIVRNYREAKNKRGQITILAELNNVSPQEIKDILKKNGVDLRGGSYKTPKPEETEENKITVPKDIEIPEEHLDTKTKIPEIVRQTLEEDLDFIEQQMRELISKKIAIRQFLEDN